MDFQGVWADMEECQRKGLAKCIGVSNFSSKKVGDILASAKIPPAINQVSISQMQLTDIRIQFTTTKSVFNRSIITTSLLVDELLFTASKNLQTLKDHLITREICAKICRILSQHRYIKEQLNRMKLNLVR